MQRYFAKEKKEEYFLLFENDLYHIQTVMRMRTGDLIEVVYEKKVYECCLENVNQNIQIKVIKEQKKKDQLLPHVYLWIPLLTEQKMDFIFQKATELGVSGFFPYPAKRSIIKVKTDKLDRKRERWQLICKEASEQSKRVDIPIVYPLQEDIPSLQNGLCLIASTKKNLENIKNVLKKNRNCATINIVIGPEGGFDSLEEANWIQKGFLPMSLGDRILRVETVPLYVMSAINYEYME